MNLTLKLSQLNGLIGDLFQYAGKFVQNLFNSIMGLLLIAVYQILVAPFLLLADGIQLFFKKLAGLDTYYVNGQEQSGDIVLSLINNKTVQDVFWALLILGVVLLIITTIVALVRTETQAVDSKDRKSKNKIFSESVRALFNFFMVPVVAILGIFMGNALLKALDGATIGSGKSSETRISTYIFRASAYEANRARNDIAFADDLRLNHFNDMGVIQGTDQESIAQAIDEAFINFTSIDNKKFKYPSQNLFADDGTYLHLLTFSTYHVTGANSVKSYFSIYDAPMVFYYYDLASFNFILCWIGIFFVIWVLFSTALGLVKRIFKLTILLVVSPPIVAISPLDNGAALGKWKKQFIGSTLSAYSTVVSLNLVFLLLGPVTNIDLFKVGRVGIAASLLNNISTLIITIGALLFFKDFTKNFADMIGGEDAYADGSKAVADGAKKVAKGVMGTVGLAGGLANLNKAHKMKSLGDTETAQKYQDMAKARFKQMGANYGSLATNGITDGILKDMGDYDKLTGVSKAKKGLEGAKTVKEANKEHQQQIADKARGTTSDAIETRLAAIKSEQKSMKGGPKKFFSSRYRELTQERSELLQVQAEKQKQIKADRADMAAGFTPEELAAEVSRIDAELQKTDKSTDRYKELLAQKAEVDRIQDEQMDPKDRAIKEQIQKSLKKAEQKRQVEKKKSQKQARKEARAERKQQVEKAKQDIDKLSSK